MVERTSGGKSGRVRDLVPLALVDVLPALLVVFGYEDTETADLLVVKHRGGPTGARPAVPWPALPRTVDRPSTR